MLTGDTPSRSRSLREVVEWEAKRENSPNTSASLELTLLADCAPAVPQGFVAVRAAAEVVTAQLGGASGASGASTIGRPRGVLPNGLLHLVCGRVSRGSVASNFETLHMDGCTVKPFVWSSVEMRSRGC